MGNASRVVLVGAMSLVVGIYGVSLKKVQSADLDASLMPVKRVQFERKAAAAVRSALNIWVGNGYAFDYGGSGNALGGGTFTYDFHYNSYYDYVDVTLNVKAYQDPAPRVVTARLQNTWGYGGMLQGPKKMRYGTWQATKYFVAIGY
jgi:hypothetical protein